MFHDSIKIVLNKKKSNFYKNIFLTIKNKSGRDFSLIFFRRKVTVSFALNSFTAAQFFLFIYLFIISKTGTARIKKTQGWVS
jgi:hypothetical protein